MINESDRIQNGGMIQMERIKRFTAALLVMVLVAALVPQTQTYAASASRKTIEIQVYNFLVGKMGFNTAAACGLMANVELESDFNVKEIGDGNTSFGLFQWHLERKKNLIKYCEEKELDYQTVEGQLSYLEYELKKSYKKIYNYIKSVDNTADGAYDAAYYWCYNYEVPSNRAYKADKRGTLARNTYWKKYKGYKGKQIEVTEANSAGSKTESSISETKSGTDTKTASAETKTVSSEDFTRTLKVKSPYMKGADVKFIQNCLKKLGYSVTADGTYGNGTSAAVKKFQTANKIKADGACNKTTWNAIKNAAAKKAVSTVKKEEQLKITQQPKAVTVREGDKTKFTVKATGKSLSYQWYYKKAGQSSWSKWTGHTTASTVAYANDSWNYMQVRCIVKDGNGKTVTSSAAKITLVGGDVAVG